MSENIYEANLRNLFHTVVETGVGTVREGDLYRWLGAARAREAFWKEIYQYFYESLSGREKKEGWQLWFVEASGNFNFVCFEPSASTEKPVWWKKINEDGLVDFRK